MGSEVESTPVNLSTRGFVGANEEVLIGGAILDAPHTAHILARAMGPSLAAAGVAGALENPSLQLFDSNGGVVASNGDWKETQADQIAATGIAPNDDREAAILADLAPGAYTAIVAGTNGTTGVGLVEIYNLR